MKKHLFLLLLFCLSVFFISCEAKYQDYLLYQNYPMTVRANLKTNNSEFSVLIMLTAKDGGTVFFEEPKTIAGYRFDLYEGSVTLSYGDLSIPISDLEMIRGIKALFELFALGKEDFLSVKMSQQNGIKFNIANYKTENGQIKVFINTETKLPTRFEANIYGNNILMNIKEITEPGK